MIRVRVLALGAAAAAAADRHQRSVGHPGTSTSRHRTPALFVVTMPAHSTRRPPSRLPARLRRPRAARRERRGHRCFPRRRGGAARNILTLACQLDEDGDGVVVAGVRESTQLLDIAAFAREFDQLVDRIAVTLRGGLAQRSKIVRHRPLLSSLPPERSPPCTLRPPGSSLLLPILCHCSPCALSLGPPGGGSMVSAMHMSDGLVDAPTALGCSGCVAVARRREWRMARPAPTSTTRTAPMAGLVAAFVFAVQMLNFPVLPGASGHLLGGALAAILVGPWVGRALRDDRAAWCRRLLFADGGLTALGANITNMALVGTSTGYLVALVAARGSRAGAGRASPRVAFVAALRQHRRWRPARSCSSTRSAARAERRSARCWSRWSALHVLIGVGEGLITAATVGAVDRGAARPRLPAARARADAVDGPAAEVSRRDTPTTSRFLAGSRRSGRRAAARRRSVATSPARTRTAWTRSHCGLQSSRRGGRGVDGSASRRTPPSPTTRAPARRLRRRQATTAHRTRRGRRRDRHARGSRAGCSGCSPASAPHE